MLDTPDDGYAFWYADLLGGASGAGYAVRVRVPGVDGCSSLSESFSLFDTQGCSYRWTWKKTPSSPGLQADHLGERPLHRSRRP